jgi:hypothetical protein
MYQTKGGAKKKSAINFLATEDFRILPEKLVSTKNTKLLMQEYGCSSKREWKELLQSAYQSIATNIQDQLSVVSIEYDDEKLGKATDAALGFASHKNKSRPVKSWAEKFSKDKEITVVDKEELLGEGGGMICSEYVAKVTAISMVQLNEALNAALGKDKDNRLVKLPLNKFENLDIISPTRLIKQLQKRRCIEPVKKAKVIGQLFR